MANPKSFKLDIFSILNKLNSGNKQIWENLSDEEKKGFSAFIITRWMSGTSDALTILLLNEFVNPYIFTLDKHPELLAKLLACCGNGQSNRRFNWIKDSIKEKTHSLSISLIKEYFSYSTKEAKDCIKLLSKDDLLEMAESLGWQNDDIKKLKKELA
jgi:hypothetical protein